MHIFSGIHKNRSLESPKGLCTRPTSGRLREALFNICQHHIEGCHFLDLFAGSGAMGLEALSRGAKHATLIDNNRESIRCIQANVRTLKEEAHADIIYGDVFDMLPKLSKQGRQYDIIYVDPPYENMSQTAEGALFHSARILKILDDYLQNNIHLLSSEGIVFIEESGHVSLENIHLSSLNLKNTRRVGYASLHFYTTSK